MTHLPLPGRALGRAGAALGAVALTAGLTLAGATAANAAPVAPSCMHVPEIDRNWASFPRASIRDDCSSLQRVKIVWASAPDSECDVLSRHETATGSTGVFREFAGLQRC